MTVLISFLEYIASMAFWVMAVWLIVDKVRKHKIPKKHWQWFWISLASLFVIAALGMATGVNVSDDDSSSSSSSSSQKSSSSSSSTKASSPSSSSEKDSSSSNSKSTTQKWDNWLQSHLVDTGQAVAASAEKNGDNYIINVKGYDSWITQDDDSLEYQLDFIRQRIIGNFDKFQGNAPHINVYSKGHLIAYTPANDPMGNMKYRNKQTREALGWIK